MAEDQKRTLQDKFMLRLPDGMRDRIRDAAETHKRSMNAEIIARLESTFTLYATEPNLPERIEGTLDPEISGMVDAIIDRIVELKFHRVESASKALSPVVTQENKRHVRLTDDD